MPDADVYLSDVKNNFLVYHIFFVMEQSYPNGTMLNQMAVPKTRCLSYFGSSLWPLNAFSSIMALVTNYGLLYEYLSSVYEIKRYYKYANMFQNIMFNLVTELF